MDGKKLLQLELNYLDELAVSDAFASRSRLFENLDMAASLFLRETGMLHSEVSITTVADQQAYDLPPDFIRPYMKTINGRWFGRYYNATENKTAILVNTQYANIFAANLTTAKSTPGCWACIDKPDQNDLITGTATASDEAEGGQCTLTDSTKDFTDTDLVHPRDTIHNKDDGENGSTGYILSVTDETNIEVALFGGTDSHEDFAENDQYIIQPGSKFQIVFDAPSENDGDTFTLPYVCMPAPVFSDYGFWRFPDRVCKGIAYGAASLFKTNVRDYSGADEIGGLFLSEIQKAREEIALNTLRTARRTR